MARVDPDVCCQRGSPLTRTVWISSCTLSPDLWSQAQSVEYFNTRLVLAIRESARLRMKNIEGRIRQLGRRERYTLTLVIVVVVFVVCELPDLLLRPSRLSQVNLQGQA